MSLKVETITNVKLKESVSTQFNGAIYDEDFNKNFKCSLRSRIPILHIQTFEERRFFRYLVKSNLTTSFKINSWDSIDGYRDFVYEEFDVPMPYGNGNNLQDVLRTIRDNNYTESINRSKNGDNGKKSVITIIRDIHYYLDNPVIFRALQDIFNHPFTNCIILLTSYDFKNHPWIKNIVKTIVPSNPNEKEYEILFQDIRSSIKNFPSLEKKMSRKKESILSSVKGMSFTEAANAIALLAVEWGLELKDLKK